MNFKIAKDAEGRVRACGPNDSNFEPAIPAGGSLELSEVALPIDPTPGELRASEIDSAIQSDSTVAALKAMTNAEFDTWWAANVTNAAQAINVLKRVTRVVIRRVL
jgi:hypothetical protein